MVVCLRRVSIAREARSTAPKAPRPRSGLGTRRCYISMKSVWTAPRVQFDPGFGVGIVGASRLATLTLKP